MKTIFYQLQFAILLLMMTNIGFALPVVNHLNPQVTLIEYYDYECPHCRSMQSVLERLAKHYPDLKIVYRVTPLLNLNSRLIASFVLAVGNPQQRERLHRKLMQAVQAPTFADAKQIAKQLGLNVPLLLHDMQKPRIQASIEQHIQQIQRYAVNGAIELPTLVFQAKKAQSQKIVLHGEQPDALLAAIVQQLSEQNN